MPTKPRPELPRRSRGRPRKSRGDFSAIALRTTLASRGFAGSWLIAQLDARGLTIDRRRVYGWIRGADIPSPDARTVAAIAEILGVTQKHLKTGSVR